ncbi:unnamed protein product, partial [Prorocentrum cordatum]
MAIGSGFFQKARRALSLAQYSELLQSIRLLNRGQHEPRAVPGGSRRDVGPPWEGGPPRRAGGADPPGCRGVWRSRRWGRVSSSRTARARRVPPGPRTVGPSKSP